MCKLFSILFVLMFLPLTVLGKEITTIDLLKAIEKEFVEQGVAGDVELEIFGGKTNFEVKDNTNIKILISNLKRIRKQLENIKKKKRKKNKIKLKKQMLRMLKFKNKKI